jgi:hypothetical protein
MHHMIASEQVVTDGQDVVKGAGEKKEQDYAELHNDDGPMILCESCSKCGHDNSSSWLNSSVLESANRV